MRYYNPKNPLAVNKQKTNSISVPMVTNKSSASSLKFSTPEIRVGLDAANKSPKMPKDKNVVMKPTKGKAPNSKPPQIKKAKM
jgi:hypothetical protein